jgi:hypothetical protein
VVAAWGVGVEEVEEVEVLRVVVGVEVEEVEEVEDVEVVGAVEEKVEMEAVELSLLCPPHQPWVGLSRPATTPPPLYLHIQARRCPEVVAERAASTPPLTPPPGQVSRPGAPLLGSHQQDHLVSPGLVREERPHL